MHDGQECLALHGELPPRRQGPPLHLHYREAEEVRVIAGTLSATVEGRPIQAGPGETAVFEAGTAHRWWNDGDETLVLEGVVRPAVDFDRYLQAMFDVVNHGTSDRPPVFYVAHVARRHRHTQAGFFIPLAVQSILFPLVVLLGTVLGRYRGDDWPGAPARSSGVPAE
jgi:uncharacterized cupin superfamily protein